MVKRIGIIVAAILLVYFCYLGYLRYKTNHDAASGEIYSDDPDHSKTHSETGYTPQTSTEKSTRSQTSTIAMNANMAAPASDSIGPNPSNGVAFAGTGKFQVYRQGNLTWRVNTESGESCILFATEEEWRRQIVYSHGCASN